MPACAAFAQVDSKGTGVMRPLRFVVAWAFYGSLLAGWVAVLSSFGSPGAESTGTRIEERQAASVPARVPDIDAPRATGITGDEPAVAIESFSAALPAAHSVPPAAEPAPTAPADTPDPVQKAGEETAAQAAAIESVSAVLPDPDPMPPAAAPTASAETPDPAQNAGAQTAAQVFAIASVSAAL